MSFSNCLTVFLALLFLSVLLQWFRAFKRKRLVASVDPADLGQDGLLRWRQIEDGFDFMFKDFRKLRILKQDISRFGEQFQSDWESYRRLSRLEMAVTSLMLIFGASAFLFCK